MATDDAKFADRLNHFLDALAAGSDRAPNGLAPPDHELAATVRQLQAHDDAPPADPRFGDRLLEDLMLTRPIAVLTLGTGAQPTTPNGRVLPAPTRLVSTASPRLHSGRPHWALAQFATAALLVLTLGIAYLALRPGPPAADRPAVLPAMGATPAAPGPGVTAEEELLVVALPADGFPHDGDVILGLLHYTIPPAAEGNWPPAHPATGCPEATCPGVELAYVLEGGLTVTAATPVEVVRGDGRGEAEPIPADTAFTLGPGDATLRPNGTMATYANAGATPVHLVLGYFAPGGIRTYQFPPGWDMHDEDSFSGAQLSEVSGPATLRLRRAVLAADAVFAAPPDTVAQVGVGESDPGALGSQSDGTLINVGDEAVTVYALALEPTEPRNATPAATSPVEFLWETSGGPDTPLGNPSHLAVSPDGSIWVADADNNRFQIFAPDGTFREVWGVSGSGEGEFDFTTVGWGEYDQAAIAFAPDGTFYVTDTGNHRVQKFGPDRRFLTAWGSKGREPGQFDTPIDLVVDGQGRVYVLDSYRNNNRESPETGAVQVFDADGQFLAEWGERGSEPGQIIGPFGIGLDPDGTLLVAEFDNNRVQRFTPEGEFLDGWGQYGSDDGEFIYAMDAAVDANGRVFVADYANGRVQVFDHDGRFLAALGKPGSDAGEFAAALGVAVGGDGTVYVTDAGKRLQAFRVGELPVAGAATPGATADMASTASW